MRTVLALVAVLASPAPAQTQFVARWERPHPSWQPNPRQGAGMAYDSARRLTLMYGGWNAGPVLYGWSGSGWRQLTTNSPPGPQVSPGFAFDPLRGRAVLVDRGGTNTWEWDGAQWTVTGVALPFGGAIAVPLVFHPGLGRVIAVTRGGVYAWDGIAWSTVQTPGPATDPLEAVFDAARNVVVLRGWLQSVSWNETWEWNGATWTNFGTQLMHGPLAFHPGLGVVAVADLGSTATALFRWDGAQWRLLDVGDLGPRFGGACAFDSQRNRIVGFGADAGDALFELTTDLARPRRTWTVGPSTPPADLRDVRDALRIALPGDRVVVLPLAQLSPAYGFRSRALELHFEPGVTLPQGSTLMFQDLPATETIVVSGPGASPAAEFAYVSLVRCAGPVVLRGLRIASTELDRWSGISAYRCPRVLVQDCVLVRAWGELMFGQGLGAPLDVHESELVLDGGSVQGGAGWVENPGTPFQRQRAPAPAAVVSDGRLFASRTALNGGAGAVSIQGYGAASATLIGASAAPTGRGGSLVLRATSDCTVPAGHATVLPALPTMSAPADATLGATVTLAISGSPGTPAALFVAVSPGLVVVPGIAMPLMLGSEAWPVANVVLNGGSANVVVPLPGDPALVRAVVYWQVLGLDASGGLGLGNARVMRLL